MNAPIHILGPQQPTPNLPELLTETLPTGALSVLSTGWRMDEEELDTLDAVLHRDLLPLPLYRWFDSLQQKIPSVLQTVSKRQGKIKEAKRVYHERLKSQWNLICTLREMPNITEKLREEELEIAVQRLQTLDDSILDQLKAIRAEIPSLRQPWTLPEVAPYHTEIQRRLERSSGLLITGGHVAILRNRMFFFGLQPLLETFLESGKPIYCWSAGAMVLCERIVLYHDDPPDGVGFPEVLDTGLGLLPDLVLFPHAQERLHMDNPVRVKRLVERFGHHCMALENGAHLRWENNTLDNVGFEDTATDIKTMVAHA